jgi:hypothetical protein
MLPLLRDRKSWSLTLKEELALLGLKTRYSAEYLTYEGENKKRVAKTV